jgi:methylated-DNA-[protein]-cysteine S-methyltransferase
LGIWAQSELHVRQLLRYAIFETRWGHFGLAGTDFAIYRTCLPQRNPRRVKAQLLNALPSAREDTGLLEPLQQQIIAYFEGAAVGFDRDISIAWQNSSPFGVRVLSACRALGFASTVSYGQLAKNIGRPSAARAVGRVLAKNPVPLIVPCHRVICANGKMGGFSALGGVSLKKKMLELERQALST